MLVSRQIIRQSQKGNDMTETQETITYDTYYNKGSISWPLYLIQARILRRFAQTKETFSPQIAECIPTKATGVQDGEWTTFTLAWQTEFVLDCDEHFGQATQASIKKHLQTDWPRICIRGIQGPSLHKGDDDKWFKFRAAQHSYRGIITEFPTLSQAAATPTILIGSIGREYYVSGGRNGTRREDIKAMKENAFDFKNLVVASHKDDFLEDAVDAWKHFPEDSDINVRAALLAPHQSAYDLIALCTLLPNLCIALES